MDLVEGIDYYMEDGLFVLTAAYLRKRGYCCGNGCRHCPYEGSEKAAPRRRRSDDGSGAGKDGGEEARPGN